LLVVTTVATAQVAVLTASSDAMAVHPVLAKLPSKRL